MEEKRKTQSLPMKSIYASWGKEEIIKWHSELFWDYNDWSADAWSVDMKLCVRHSFKVSSDGDVNEYGVDRVGLW